MRVISYWKATRVIKHHGFHHQYADTVTSMAQSTLEISDFFWSAQLLLQSTVHKRNQWCFNCLATYVTIKCCIDGESHGV